MRAESDTRPIGHPVRQLDAPPTDEPVIDLVVSPGRGATARSWREATGGAAGARFALGERVRADGDAAAAEVVAVFAKKSGSVRYVVERDDGRLRVASAAELEPG